MGVVVVVVVVVAVVVRVAVVVVVVVVVAVRSEKQDHRRWGKICQTKRQAGKTKHVRISLARRLKAWRWPYLLRVIPTAATMSESSCIFDWKLWKLCRRRSRSSQAVVEAPGQTTSKRGGPGRDQSDTRAPLTWRRRQRTAAEKAEAVGRLRWSVETPHKSSLF